MTDTQWPRFQVFVQERPGEPYLDAGSVHAPDLELALLNARDVFARRPECVSMWVVPVERIYSRTAEEISAAGWESADAAGADQPAESAETYYVFCKRKPAGTQTLVGTVEAKGPQEALSCALARFGGQPAPFAWWVFPARWLAASDPGDVDSFFAPARAKTFRLPADFHTHTAMRHLQGIE